jgi:Zn-finger protein
MVIECGILTEWYKQGKDNCTEKFLPYGYFIQHKSHVKWLSESKGVPVSKIENCLPPF